MSLPEKPITRKEKYLAAIAGQPVEIPEFPLTREEAYLNEIAKNSGGGGTSDYNQLENQPQINDNTLVGNKSASDLGLVAAVEGKGLSTNDYTDADKAIVGGVTAALAGKQNALTAGKYIDIDANNEISVEREIPDEEFTYTIQQIGDGIVKITKTVSGAVVFEETYSGDVDVTLDAIHYVYNAGVQSYTLLIASDTHEAGFKQVMSWWQRVTYTENFSTVDHSGEKLVIKSELDAAVDAIKDGANIDSFADVETALALKQDKTDNALQTTDKTIVGAVNELKSGLINYQTQNDLNLEVPDRKNLFDGNYTDIVSQTVTYRPIKVADGNYTISTTCPQNSLNGANIFFLSGNVQEGASTANNGVWEGNTRTVASANGYITIAYKLDGGVDPRGYDTQIEYGSTSTAYTPYIPSVESRIEAVESGLINLDIALSVPDGTGKNLLPMTLASLKARNTSGTWVDNVYTLGNVSCTVNTDSTGAVTSLQTTAASTGEKNFVLYVDVTLKKGSYILSSGFNETYRYKDTLLTVSGGTVIARGNSEAPGQSFTLDSTVNATLTLRVKVDEDITAYLMIRPATITDPTFAPYIPSVESRIEAVERNQMIKTSETVTLNANGVSRLSLTLAQGRIVYAIKVGGDYNAYLVLPYCTTVDNNVWAVKVVNPDDMSPVASKEVTIAYGYLP